MLLNKVLERLKIAEALPWFVTFSGGKDSTALLDVVYRYGKSFAVIHSEELLKLRTHFEWTYGVLSRLAERGVDVHVVVPKEDYLTAVFERRYSPPGPSFQWCTARFKTRPAARLAKELSVRKYALLTAVRMEESARRAAGIKARCGACGAYHIQLLRDDVIHLAPIVDWSTSEVIAYLKTHRQPWSGESYDFLLNKVYCGEPAIRTGCSLCTLVGRDAMLERYAQCLNDPRYLKVAQLKRKLREIGFDWDMRMPMSKKLNDRGLAAVRELLLEIFSTMPELLSGYAAFKPHVVEKHLPELAGYLPKVAVKLPDSVHIHEL
mgnify:CR=1 FL=1